MTPGGPPAEGKPRASESALLTIKQVRTRLATSDKTVRRLVQRGDLVAIRIGRQLRVAEADLQHFLDEHRYRPLSKRP